MKQAVKQGMEAGCDGGRDGDVKEGVKEVGSWEWSSGFYWISLSSDLIITS